MFLATPHRGANYAKLLNTVLEASPFGTSKKEYVAQLETASQVIQDINDDFRLSGAELILVSFYETEKMHFTRGVNKIASTHLQPLVLSLMLSDCRSALRGARLPTRTVGSIERHSSEHLQVQECSRRQLRQCQEHA